MNITTIGIDLAKNVFQIHGIDHHGQAVLRKKLNRDKMLEFFTKMQPCLIGMEACGSAHYWARKLVAMGHTVRLMAPQFVKPYVKTNKNDAADAKSYLRSSHPTQYALCSRQDGRAAGNFILTSSAPRICEIENRASQSDSRLTIGVWRSDSTRDCQHG